MQDCPKIYSSRQIYSVDRSLRVSYISAEKLELRITIIHMLDPEIIKYQIRDAVIYWILIPAAVILTGMTADYSFALPEFPYSSLLVITASMLLMSGLLLIWRSTKDLADAGGTPNPLRPPKKIVTTGSYAICRHPMFLGYDLCALSVVLYLRSPGMLWISFPVFLLFEVRFLRKEERILLLKFKQSYAEYKTVTSFLLPLLFIKKKFKRQLS